MALCVFLIACARSLSSLSPFPCAADGTCPVGFACAQAMDECMACNGPAPDAALADAGDVFEDGGAASPYGQNDAGSSTLVFCGTSCTDLRVDPGNCGSCGHFCVGGCVDGECQQVASDKDAGPADSGCAPIGPCGCAPGGGRCTVAPACGCSELEKCARDDGKPEACLPSGSEVTGGACTVSSECQGKDVCFAGRCVAPCDPGSACAGGAACTPAYANGVDQGFSVCLDACDPLDPARAVPPSFVACRADERCVLVGNGTDAAYCATATGSQKPGGDCRTTTDCEPGSDCAIFAGDKLGTCLRLCTFDSETKACPAEEICIPVGVTIAGSTLGDCEAPCNLLSPGARAGQSVGEVACKATQSCLLFTTPEGIATGCFAITGKLALGDPCGDSSQCPQGSTCVTSETNSADAACLAWCVIGSTCPGGSTCTPFVPAVDVPPQQYGYCES